VRNLRESRRFEEAIREELALYEAVEARPDARTGAPRDRERFPYLARGLYAEQLARWFRHFPRESFLILRSEDLFADPSTHLRRTLSFLGLPGEPLPAFSASNRGGYRAPIPGDVRAELDAFFRPHNRGLEELLGREFSWGDDAA